MTDLSQLSDADLDRLIAQQQTAQSATAPAAPAPDASTPVDEITVTGQRTAPAAPDTAPGIAPAASKFRWNPLDVIGSAEKAAWEKLKADYHAGIGDHPQPNLLNLGSVVGDVAGLAGLAPAAALAKNYVIDPASKALASIPAQAYTKPELKVVDGKLTITKPRPLTKDETEKMWQDTLGTAAGAVGAPGVGSAADVAALATEAAAKGAVPSAMDANRARFDQAGVRDSLATVGGPFTRLAAGLTAKGPLAFGARANLAGQVGDVGDSAAALAAKYGTPLSPQLAGEGIQSGIKAFVGDVTDPTSFKGKSEALYDKAFEPVQVGETQAVDRVTSDQAAKAQALHEQYVQDVADAHSVADLRNAKGAGVFEPDLPEPPVVPDVPPVLSAPATTAKLQEIGARINSPAISNIISDKRIPNLLQAFQDDPASIRFGDLRQLRTWVRNAQGNPELVLGVGKGNLNSLESALTQDIYSNAERFGGADALDKLKSADDYYKTNMELIRTALKPFDDASSGEGAMARLQSIAGGGRSADVAQLSKLRGALSPSNWNDVQASYIQNLGQDVQGGKTVFSPTKFVDGYGKIPPASKNVLFGKVSDPLRTQLDNLVSVAADVSNVEKLSKPLSGASGYQATGAILAAMYHLFNPSALLAEVGALGTEAGVAQVLTSPKAVRWVSRLASATTKGADALPTALVALNKAAQADPSLKPIYEAAQSQLAKASGQKQDTAAPVAPADPNDLSRISDTDLDAMIANGQHDDLHARVMRQESGGDPNAVSPKGAEGAMQVMPKTQANPGLGVTPARDDSAAEKERVGHDYLDALLNKYRGNKKLALAAYNAGPGTIDKWLSGEGGDIPAETHHYVKAILGENF